MITLRSPRDAGPCGPCHGSPACLPGPGAGPGVGSPVPSMWPFGLWGCKCRCRASAASESYPPCSSPSSPLRFRGRLGRKAAAASNFFRVLEPQDADGLEDGAHRSPRDDARAGRSRLQEHAPRAVTANDGMRDRRALQGDLLHVLLGHLDALLDGHRDLLGLAGAIADPALAVAHHHESGEREVLAALDDLRHAVDVDDAVDQLSALRVAFFLALARRARAASPVAAHRLFLMLLKLQPDFAGRIGQGLDLPVIDVPAAVENHSG